MCDVFVMDGSGGAEVVEAVVGVSGWWMRERESRNVEGEEGL